MSRKNTKFSWWIVPLALIVAIAGSLVWFRANPVVVQAQSSSVDLSKLTTAQVQTGSISSSIAAFGTVRSNQSISLDWQMSGQVGKVLVKPGDQVQAGQILAQIDPSSSTILITAQANLLTAQQNLANIQNVAVAQAQALVNYDKALTAVQNDQNELTALNQPPSQASISEANYAYLNDQQEVTQLQNTYDYWIAYMDVPHCTISAPGQRGGGFGGGFGGGGGAVIGNMTLPRCNTLSNDQILLQQARANSALQAEIQKMNSDHAILNSLLNFKPNQQLVTQAQNNLAIAQAQLSSAKTTWDGIKNGPNPDQVAAAQAKITSIQGTISEQYIRAPFAGTVTDGAVKPGDLVSSGTYAFEINNLHPLYADLQVSEIDINNVKVGQPVTLTFYVAPDKTYHGSVTALASVGTVSNGVSNFDVTTVLSDSDSLIKPGMTTIGMIITGTASNVLIVPLQAIVTQGSGSIVYVVSENQLKPVSVTLGLTSSTQAEVTSSQLKAGDVIVTDPTDIPAAISTPTPSSLNRILQSLGVVTPNTSSDSAAGSASISASNILTGGK